MAGILAIRCVKHTRASAAPPATPHIRASPTNSTLFLRDPELAENVVIDGFIEYCFRFPLLIVLTQDNFMQKAQARSAGKLPDYTTLNCF